MANRTKNRNKGSKSQAHVEKRRGVIQTIINSAYKDGATLSTKYLLTKLAEAGYKIDRSTLYQDRVALAHSNNFVRDLAESTYSQMMEEMYNKLTSIEEEAEELYKKKWEKRVIKSKAAQPEEGARLTVEQLAATPDSLEKEIHEDEATPKAMFLRIQKECIEQKVNLFTGDPLHVSVAFLGKKLDEYKRKYEEASGQNIL